MACLAVDGKRFSWMQSLGNGWASKSEKATWKSRKHPGENSNLPSSSWIYMGLKTCPDKHCFSSAKKSIAQKLETVVDLNRRGEATGRILCVSFPREKMFFPVCLSNHQLLPCPLGWSVFISCPVLSLQKRNRFAQLLHVSETTWISHLFSLEGMKIVRAVCHCKGLYHQPCLDREQASISQKVDVPFCLGVACTGRRAIGFQ